ncbi:MAG TPA: CHAT domain-containing protein, partial [Thermoanaerobaculia bacterium]
ALLVGNPAFHRSALTQDLKPLPHAAEEVSSIRPLYPGAVVFLGREATADRFFALAGTSAVVHFAGHAVTNPRFPFRSFLLFAPSESHSGELFAEELLSRLQLRKTRLVVLGACDTAGGHPIGPEGLAALVRPLSTAGAPAVVGSLWKVNDQMTKELLVGFHRHFVAGEDAASALRNAQLDFLNKGKGYGAAISWAPFQVIGYASAPFPPDHQRRDTP